MRQKRLTGGGDQQTAEEAILEVSNRNEIEHKLNRVNFDERFQATQEQVCQMGKCPQVMARLRWDANCAKTRRGEASRLR